MYIRGLWFTHSYCTYATHFAFLLESHRGYELMTFSREVLVEGLSQLMRGVEGWGSARGEKRRVLKYSIASWQVSRPGKVFH